MKVNALQQFLRSLVPALRAAHPEGTVAGDLEAVCDGLTPFASVDVAPFAVFLSRAEGYRERGEVSVPKTSELATEQVHMQLSAFADAAAKIASSPPDELEQAKSDFAVHREAVVSALTDFLKPLGLVGTFKVDAKAIDAAILKSKMGRAAARLREILAEVKEAGDLSDPTRQEQLASFRNGMDVAELKALATDLGAATTPAAKMMDNIVAKLTGFQPAPAKKAAKAPKAVTIDEAIVREYAVKFNGLVEKSQDPEGLSDQEVDGMMGELDSRNIAELLAIAGEVNIDNAGKTKKAVLARLQSKLTQVRRVRESAQV